MHDNSELSNGAAHSGESVGSNELGFKRHVADLSVDLRRGDARVSQQPLNESNVDAGFEQLGGCRETAKSGCTHAKTRSSARVADVACGSCGEPLEDDSSAQSPRERQPCPRCGSKARAFAVHLSGALNIKGSLSMNVSVTPKLVELQLTGHAPTVQISAADGIALGTSEAQAIGLPHIASTTELFPPSVSQTLPDVLIQATIVTFGAKTSEGQLIAGVAVPWFEIVRHLQRDPAFLYRIHWRQLEELIAGAYERDGWPDVILTPRSGDGGRDVIASKPGVGSIRILDQVKAYDAGHLVKAEEVRAMLGVLEAEQNVSKGLITTSSSFAPGISADARLKRFMPFRLELKDGQELLKWLGELANKRHQ